MKLTQDAQLLFDDHVVEWYKNLTRTIHQPVMHPANPVLTHEEPWEFGAVMLWGTVIYDEQDELFKMWYETWTNEASGALPGWSSPVCYATSTDGVHWERPKLKLVNFKMRNPDDPDGPPLEYPVNNIVFNLSESELGMDSPTVVKDLDDPDPQFRYKMSYWHRLPTGTGIYQAHSPDGIHWTHIPKIVVGCGDRNTFHFDQFRRKWVVVTHPAASFYELKQFAQFNNGFVRAKVDIEERDKQPPMRSTDIYSFTAFNYARMQIGLAEMYGRDTTNRWVSYLAWSYDGVKWTIDPERVQWMPWDETPGTFDCWRRNIHNGGVIRRGDELWIYFSGRSQGKDIPGRAGYLVPSGEPGFDPRSIVGSIGLAKLRLDGFCSRDADNSGGSLTTRLITFEGRRLYVNAEVHEGGYIKAGFVDESGDPVDGFGLDESDGARSDSVAHQMSWRGKSDIGTLAGRPVRLVIELKNAALYSFRLAD